MTYQLTTTFLCLLLTARLCGAAITAATIWEVRPTNGSNLNGACFDATIANAGTDYSQQNTAQASFTDLATTGAVTTVTSASAQFTAAMVGNCLRVESGTNWTIGWYQITAYTNSTTVTVDRAPASGAGVSGVGKVGGATKSLSGQTTATLAAGGGSGGGTAAGNTIYIKNEAWNAAEIISTDGTVNAPKVFEGYNTTRGDAPTGSTRPHNNKAGSGTPFTVSASNVTLKYLWGSHSVGSGFNMSGNNITCIHCRGSNNALAGFTNSNSPFALVACEADTNTQAGIVASASGLIAIVGCNVHGNTTIGISMQGNGQPTLVDNIIAANGSHGVSITNTFLTMINNTVDANTGASTDGLNGASLQNGSLLLNNSFTNNGRDGVRMTSTGTGSWPDYNDFNGNTGTARTNLPTGGHDVTAAPSYTATGSGNYTPRAGSGLIGAGFPGSFPAATSVGKLDIGAVQTGLAGASQRAIGCVQ